VISTVYKEVIQRDGSVERFEPYYYECGNYMRGDSTKSDEKMVPEANLLSLGAWIEFRKVNGLPGGVRMKSLLTGKKGLHTIAKIEVQ
jgi:hypothetical protein